jgi:Concanavalin A-like lectin/glucanases superfamily/PLAT/LH2 domain
MARTDNFVKTYADKKYKYTTLVRHKGTPIALAMDDKRRIYYTVLNLNDSEKQKKTALDVNFWQDNPKELKFPREIAQVGYGVADQAILPLVKKGTSTPVAKGINLKPEEIDNFLSTTAKLSADVPFQVISDGKYVCVFRQAIGKEHPDMVFADSNKTVPIVDNTLLLDRFVLVGSDLELKREVRYQRSRSKNRPESEKDSLGAEDLEGKPFIEPTQELDFVRNLTGGRFSVLMLPTQIAGVKRWQIFAHNTKTNLIDSINIEQSLEGLFNTKGTEIADDSETPASSDGLPTAETELRGYAETALQFDGTDDYLQLPAVTYDFSKGITVEAWVYYDRYNSFSRIIDLGNGADRDNILLANVGSTNELALYVFVGGAHQNISAPNALETGKWIHVAATIDATGKAQLYKNGQPLTPGNTTVNLPPTIQRSSNYIGRSNWSNDAYFAGRLDELRLWSRSRSADEIKADMDRRLVGYEPQLVGYWRFDEGSGTGVTDQSNNANIAIAYGSPNWVKSGILLKENASVSRSSFFIESRSIVSGMSATLYYQQENQTAGYEKESKPLKQNARVMLSFATNTGGNNKNEIAVLDFGVSSRGKIAQVADKISLPTLNSYSGTGSSINDLLDSIAALEGTSQQLTTEISDLNTEIYTIKQDVDRKPQVQNEIAVLQNEISQLTNQKNQLTTQKQQLEQQLNTLRTNQYIVRVYTANVDSAGTDANVYLTIRGDIGITAQRNMDNAENNFERGKVDTFGYSASDIGDAGVPQSIDLWFDHSGIAPGWCLSQVQIDRIDGYGSKTYTFDAGNRWLEYAQNLTLWASPSERTVANKRDELQRTINQLNGTNTQLASKQSQLTTKNADLAYIIEREKLYNSKIALRNAKSTELQGIQVEISQKKAALKGDVQLPMPLIGIDPYGLTLSGAILGFAWTKDTPLLFDSATGQLALYFRGQDGQFFVAYYNTLTGKAQFSLKAGSSNVIASARSAEPEMDKITIKVEDGQSPTRCQITITGPNSITETWQQVPRQPQQFASVLNGLANETIYIGKLSQAINAGTVTAIDIVGSLQIPLVPEGILLIKDRRLKLSQAVDLCVTQVSINSTNFTKSIADGTPVYLLQGNNPAIQIGTIDGTFSGTVSTLRIASKTEWSIGVNAALKISTDGTDYTCNTTAAASLGKNTLTINSSNFATNLPQDTPVYFIAYDYAANAQSTKADSALSNGSLLIVTSDGGATSNVENSTATSGQTPACQWVAAAPGNCLAFDGKDDLVNLADTSKLSQLIAARDLTLETWVKPDEVKDKARLIHHVSPTCNYTLGVEKRDLTSAFQFNGSADHIQLPATTYDFSKGITIEAWVYYDRYNSFSRIIDLGNGADRDNILLANVGSTNELALYVFVGGAHQNISAPNALETGKWIHVAATIDATGKAQLYKNGQPLTPGNTTVNLPPTIQRSSNYIGRSNWSTDAYFAGRLDEIRLWNFARTAGQISADYTRRLGGNEVGLVAYWHFDNAIAKDYSRQRQDGKVVGNLQNIAGPIPAYSFFAGVGSKYLKAKTILACKDWNHLAASYRQAFALQWDGKDSYLDCGNDTTLDIFLDLTLEVFLKLDDLSQPRGIISKGILDCQDTDENSYGVTYALYVQQDGKVAFAFEDSDRKNYIYTSNQSLQAGQFYRIAVTRKMQTEVQSQKDAAGNITSATTKKWFDINIYIDKQQRGYYKYEGPDIPTNNQSLLLGKSYRENSNAMPFKGMIGEVRIWNVARTNADIATKINGQEKGLISWWHFEENDGNIAKDSKSSNHGKIKGGCTWVKSPDPEGSLLLLYCNGTAISTETMTAPVTGDNQFTLGAVMANGLQEIFQGTLEETRLWQVFRSEEQIQDNLFRRLLGEREDLLAYYTYDAESGSLLKDESLLGNHLALNRALTFDGVDDYLLMDQFQWSTGGAVTVEFWVKVNTADVRSNGAFSVGNQGGSVNRFQAHLTWVDQVLYWDYGDIGGNGRLQVNYTPYLDKWTHVALVSEGNNGKFKGIYLNGNLVASGTVSDGPDIALTGLYIGQSQSNFWKGAIDDFRIWNVVRTADQIKANMNQRLSGGEVGLVGYWRFNEGCGTVVRDRTSNANHGNFQGAPTWIVSNAPVVPPYIFSTAPISDDTCQVRSALAGIKTAYHDFLDTQPGVQEYGDLQYDSANNLIGVHKRCYSYVKDGQWQLITGFKVGNLITEWLCQVQTSPQLIGFIEGSPPVPSENLTKKDPTRSEDYAAASAIELTDAQSTTYTYSSSRDKGFDTSMELFIGLGFKSKTLAGIGLATSAEENDRKFGAKRTLESSYGWLEDSSTGVGRITTKASKLEMQGYWENENALAYPKMGRRFVPENLGFALVQSETADMFALRLAHNNALVSLQMRPNPDIPKDWNLITFPLNPRYVKQGTLDGKIGFEVDPDYPNAKVYSSNSSYFKPIEAYNLKNRIRREEEALKTQYDQFDAGRLGRRESAVHFTSGDLAVGNSVEKLPKLHKRNLVNTYVWTWSGGLFAETQEVMDVQQETTGGSYAFKGMAGAAWDVAISLSKALIATEGNLMFGGHLNLTVTKDVTSETSFALNVEMDVERDIYEETPDGKVVMDLSDPKRPKPKLLPGKVNAYRFMSFYLEPQIRNFDEFFGRVVDPIWLSQSSDPDAVALRQARQIEKKPPCWRILHRVTFVSRVLPEFPDPTAPPLEKALVAVDIDSNYELIQQLDPYVRDSKDSYSTLAQAVGEALDTYLPELVAYKAQIAQFMADYYGVLRT